MIADGMNEQPSQTTEPDASPSIHQDDGCDTPMPVQLPLNFSCLTCSYDLSNSPIRRCPECGRVVTSDDLQISHARLRLLARERLLRRRSFSAMVAVVLVYGLGLYILSRFETLLGVLAAGTSLAMLGGSLVSGALIIFLAPKPPALDRRLLMLVWIVVAWWVNGPWLILPACVAVLCLAALVDSDFVETLAAIGLIPWGLWWTVCLVMAFASLHQCTRNFALNKTRRNALVLFLLGTLLVLIWFAAAGVSLAGGAVGTIGVEHWIPALRP